MFNRILLIGCGTTLGDLLNDSLASEGYEVTVAPSLADAQNRFAHADPHLVIINGIGQTAAWSSRAEQKNWPVPIIILVDQDTAHTFESQTEHRLVAPFAFQDLLLLVQDALYQRTLTGRRPFQLPPALIDKIAKILSVLRDDLRARSVILSSATGRLIETAGMVDRGVAISLAALMAGGFSATAQAAQLLGHGEAFDSNLQESEGYGLYAIRLHNRLILSVAFSDKITVGMVRHYTAQAAVDILEVLAREASQTDAAQELDLDADFCQTVNQALGDILNS
jgi:predicted regulator of Ras-like GTPase activity (Roadblock/LC7/MglB family)/CheY-like chemotaxis protein